MTVANTLEVTCVYLESTRPLGRKAKNNGAEIVLKGFKHMLNVLAIEIRGAPRANAGITTHSI